MNIYQFKNSQNRTFIRVSKAKAARIYANSQPVVLCPVNLCPFGGWNPSVQISLLDEYANDFAYRCARYKDQFPQDKECGRYLAYYIPIL